MIAVIADDLTGAAELAGISLRYGLKVEVFFGAEFTSNADVVIVCTDSRSLNREDAKNVTADTVEQIRQLNPSLIYKKIDSVLRGYVIDEVSVQMKLCGYEKVLIVPANPSLARIIHNGEYFVNGEPISQTGFADDPEFPVKSSRVKEMVDDAVVVLNSREALPATGIVVGEAETGEDIRRWADVAKDDCMLVGAGDFYSAILDKYFKMVQQPPVEMKSPHLYVCGTAFKARKEYLKTLKEKQDCVSYLPATIDDEWISKMDAIVRQQKKLVIAIDEADDNAATLRLSMAKAVQAILGKEEIKEVFIEGGSTAAAVLKELSIKKLSAVNELQRGVVRMKAKNLFITMKPGSYELPGDIKALYM